MGQVTVHGKGRDCARSEEVLENYRLRAVRAESAAYAPPVAADPVGLSDIARRLGVHQQTTKQWKLRGLLPEPKWHVGGRPAWEWKDIERWAKKTGRL